MDYNNELNNLKDKEKQLTKELSSLQGEFNLLQKQIDNANFKIKEIDEQRLIYKKSVEFLRKVEESTKLKLKEGFENLITFSLRSICQDDYGFKFEFNKRGNRQELNFLIKTPECQEYHDPLDTQAGGVLDVVSFALRLALLQKTRIGGIIVLDEAFKHLSKNNLNMASKFLKIMYDRLNKQFLLVTHKSDLTQYAENIIDLNKKEENNG